MSTRLGLAVSLWCVLALAHAASGEGRGLFVLRASRTETYSMQVAAEVQESSGALEPQADATHAAAEAAWRAPNPATSVTAELRRFATVPAAAPAEHKRGPRVRVWWEVLRDEEEDWEAMLQEEAQQAEAERVEQYGSSTGGTDPAVGVSGAAQLLGRRVGHWVAAMQQAIADRA